MMPLLGKKKFNEDFALTPELVPFLHPPEAGQKCSGNPYRRKTGADFGGKGTDTSQGTILFSLKKPPPIARIIFGKQHC
jgi:hypothetical protein